MISLWNHIYDEQQGILALFSGMRPEPGSKRLEETCTAYFSWPSERERARRWAECEAASGKETYHCAHLLTARRRIKDNAAPLSALYVDGDGAKPSPSMPQPTATVESSPGREQFYWQLSQPVAPEIGESLNRRLAYAMGGDRSGWDLTQLLRPPGTHNHKYPDAPLVVLRARRETDMAHDPDELDRLLPPLPDEAPREAGRAWPTDPLGGSALDDTELVERAKFAANGENFVRLWGGDRSGYPSASESDLALVGMLLFWTGGDVDQADRLFRQSGLMRDKWLRTDYRERTFRKALEGRTEFYSPPMRRRQPKVYGTYRKAVRLGV